MDTEHLTTAAAAARVGVDPSRIRQLCAGGALPGARRLGRDWLIPAEALATWLAQRPVGGPGYPAGRPRK